MLNRFGLVNLAIVFHETDQLRFMYRGWLGFRVPQPIRLCRFLVSKEGLDHGVWRRDLFLVLSCIFEMLYFWTDFQQFVLVFKLGL